MISCMKLRPLLIFVAIIGLCVGGQVVVNAIFGAALVE